MVVLFATFSVFLITVWLRYLLHRRKFWKINDLLPGDPTYPFIGNGLLSIGMSNTEIMKIIRTQIAQHGTPFRIWLGPVLCVVVDHPDDAKIILNSPATNSKSWLYKFLTPRKEVDGLITLNGDLWKYHRKLLNPCFIPKILDAFLPIFNNCSNVMVDKLEACVAESKPFDVEHIIHCCTFDQICATMMGVELNIQKNVDHQMMISCDRFLNIVTNRFYKFWLYPDFIYRRTKAFVQQTKDTDYIVEFTRNVLSKIREEHAVVTQVKPTAEDECKPISFISQLLKISSENDAFDNNEVISETLTAIMAGTETSAGAMANTVLLLAMYPGIQEKVVNELHEVFPTQNVVITKEHLNKLVYLEMVIKESMRLLIVSPIYVRQTIGEVTLANGVTLPPGCQVAVFADTLHRRKDLWGDDADEFNPEHFSPERTHHPYSYLPFSGGPRICIGYKYAYMSMKVVLASMLRQYKFSTHLRMEDLEWDISITLKLINKHMVTAEKRVW